MHHDSTAYRGGFTGMGALMDPDFLRDATHPEDAASAASGSHLSVWCASAWTHAAGWFSALLHRRH